MNARKPIAKISEQTFNEIKSSGFGVPRFKDGYTIAAVVGKEYKMTHAGTSEKIDVRVTQDCPIAYIVLKNKTN